MDSHIEFKRKIDNARNILVGAVPSPAGQIDQITYALIYKFMSDIDDKSARLPGGTRQYFVNEYEKYDWHNLMRLDGQDKLNRYRDALSVMSKNEHLPEIFRSIYQNAFLPYNDPRTLNLFLKEIDGFVHTKSDAIGDAYEYLLSITGAQGDVGQFRTPRHIIKFIVDVIQPGKDDTVLDPACGTAGFLIAAYNYVRMQHDGVGEDGEQNGEQRLTADERKKLHGNYYGFDIDPTMVRTATVNMYLHGFSTPNIEIHDTLTSEEHWQNRYDVILANPPFMTPKGGIQPHGKFGVKANRAEVLFVDYIASHLKPNGRAGIIVPEGIIFQSGTAYKELRKSLVENSLYAVISLPSGVFNPYAGVKTSILLLDKELAGQSGKILFVDIKNIGVTLDAKQSKKTGSDLPEALEIIRSFKNGDVIESSIGHAVDKSKISESPDYNLSGSRYVAVEALSNSDYPVVELDELITESRERVKGQSLPVWSVSNKHGFVDPEAHFSKQVASEDKSNYKVINQNNFAYNPSRINVGSLALNVNQEIGCVSPMYVVFSANEEKILPTYLLRLLESEIFSKFVQDMAQGAVRTQLKFADLIKFKIPLPPIEIQREIIAELDGYQKIIDAAQTIVKTHKPTIKINPEWDLVTLGDYVSVNNGQVLTEFDPDGQTACIKVGDMNLPENTHFITMSSHRTNKQLKGLVDVGSVIFPKRGAAIATNKKRLSKIPCYVDNNCMAITVLNSNVLESYFLYYFMLGFDLSSISNSAGVALINNPDIKGVKIPLPPIEAQREIVAELEAEQQLINANKKLIEIYQQKIKSKIAEVWGE
ncbi:restriction endonuclease subunit M/S [Candidatus Saccharibacteria bacterium]|nr:restriction endonuclease subunit M/S [Candidatus Saccharibacteria bacterium]NCU38499.1 restriction endonuclease subunit M/S [Candidatus Saccharibacteria bacterium]